MIWFFCQILWWHLLHLTSKTNTFTEIPEIKKQISRKFYSLQRPIPINLWNSHRELNGGAYFITLQSTREYIPKLSITALTIVALLTLSKMTNWRPKDKSSTIVAIKTTLAVARFGPFCGIGCVNQTNTNSIAASISQIF